MKKRGDYAKASIYGTSVIIIKKVIKKSVYFIFIFNHI